MQFGDTLRYDGTECDGLCLLDDLDGAVEGIGRVLTAKDGVDGQS